MTYKEFIFYFKFVYTILKLFLNLKNLPYILGNIFSKQFPLVNVQNFQLLVQTPKKEFNILPTG